MADEQKQRVVLNPADCDLAVPRFFSNDPAILKLTLSENFAVSTILFTILQLLWQVVFVIWHIYCVYVNIRTDEWIKWKKYPEFQLVIPPKPGQSFTNIRLWNPYDKGIVQNVKEFLAIKH